MKELNRIAKADREAIGRALLEGLRSGFVPLTEDVWRKIRAPSLSPGQKRLLGEKAQSSKNTNR